MSTPPPLFAHTRPAPEMPGNLGHELRSGGNAVAIEDSRIVHDLSLDTEIEIERTRESETERERVRRAW